MTRFTKRLGLLSVAAATALLVVGVATASAHGRGGAKSVSTSALVTEAAKQLNVARADLKAAIVQSAEARVDAAVADEDITSDEGDQLKADIEDNLNVAYQVSQTSTVAANLKITTKDLNAGFRAARKALASKAIDTALANGDITADEATAAKTALDSRRSPATSPAASRTSRATPTAEAAAAASAAAGAATAPRRRRAARRARTRRRPRPRRRSACTARHEGSVRFTRGPPCRAALGVPHSNLSARAQGLPRAG